MQYKAATNFDENKLVQRQENMLNCGKLVLTIKEDEPSYIFNGSNDNILKVYYVGKNYSKSTSNDVESTQMGFRNNKYILYLSKVDADDKLEFHLVNKKENEVLEKCHMSLSKIIVSKKMELYGSGKYNNSVFIVKSKYAPMVHEPSTSNSTEETNDSQ